MKWRIVCPLLLSLGVSPAIAANYYVSPSGSDSNPGTQASPWATWSKAISGSGPGDTVNFTAGTWRTSVLMNKSGTASAPITYKGMPGAVIDGANVSLGQWGALVNLAAPYIRFEGFEVKNASAYMVYVGNNAHHVQIVGNDVHHGAMSCVVVERTTTTPAMSSILNNKAHDCGQGGIVLWRYEGGYWLIEGNEVYNNAGNGNYDGIQIGGGSGAGHHIVVRRNNIYGNGASNPAGADQLDLGGHGLAHHYLAESNSVAPGQCKMHTGDLTGAGVPGSEWQYGVSGYVIVRGNAFRCSYVVYAFPDPLVMYHNTFYDAKQVWFVYGADSSKNQRLGDVQITGTDAGRHVLKNNIYYNVGSTNYMIMWGAPSGGTIEWTYRSLRFTNNMYRFGPNDRISWNLDIYPGNATGFAQWQACCSPDKPEVGSFVTTATPTQVFVAPPGDLHLAAGSPAIDKGVALTKTTAAGTNSKTVPLDRSSYFFDGYCSGGECLGQADSVMIGGTGPHKIATVNDAPNTITLVTATTWTSGAAVTLPYSGNAPDLGMFEFASNEPPPQQCVYTYSEWGSCQSNNTQTRTVLSSVPAGCTGTPVTTQACTYTPPTCTYTYSEWGACQSDNTQSRTVSSSAPAGCMGTPVTSQSCTYDPGTCTYVYSSWADCDVTGHTHRHLISVTPPGCVLTPPEEMTHRCEYVCDVCQGK